MAAEQLSLTRGFAATTVDAICETAGVSKGAFFHYFDGKDELGKAALERFVLQLIQQYEAAPFHAERDPLARCYGYIDFTIEICQSAVLRNGCLVGAFSLELAETHPDIRALCAQTFAGWAQGLEQDLEAARVAYAPSAAIDSRSLAYHFIALLEGALILARALERPEAVRECLEHFREYLQHLFAGNPWTEELSS